jgi:hypothetical protein
MSTRSNAFKADTIAKDPGVLNAILGADHLDRKPPRRWRRCQRAVKTSQ